MRSQWRCAIVFNSPDCKSYNSSRTQTYNGVVTASQAFIKWISVAIYRMAKNIGSKNFGE